MNKPSPAIVTQTSVKPLPRFWLWMVCCAYILAGFIGREPWRGTDLSTYASIAQLKNFSWHSITSDQLFNGNLVYWLAGLLTNLINSPILTNVFSQILFIAALAIALYTTRLSVYYLAQTKAAQPISFAFGGEANPKDYATAIADAALLAMLANLGLASLGHELGNSLIHLCATSILILSGSIHWQKPKIALVCLIFASILLIISAQPLVCLLLLLAINFCLYLQSEHFHPKHKLFYHLVSFILTLICLWLVLIKKISFPSVEHLSFSFLYVWLKLYIWFFWPCWIIAIWGIWKWRRQIMQPHILLPLTIAISTTILSLFFFASEKILFLALPSSAILAAFALPTLKRSISSFIDWLTLLLFTSTAIFLWIMWFAGVFGIPSQLHLNIAKQLQNYQMKFQWLPFVCATIASILWLLILRWRTSRYPQVIWKSLVLPAYGVSLCWFLLNTIWLTPLNASKGYQLQMQQLFNALPKQPDCIYLHKIDRNTINALYHYSKFTFYSQTDADIHNCQWLITTNNVSQHNLTNWKLTKKINPINVHKQTLWLYQAVKG